VDVANKFQEIRIFFADDGFVSVLEEVPRAFMPFVEGNGVSGHECDEGQVSTFNKPYLVRI
jgi:hypothetical protein